MTTPTKKHRAIADETVKRGWDKSNSGAVVFTKQGVPKIKVGENLENVILEVAQLLADTEAQTEIQTEQRIWKEAIEVVKNREVSESISKTIK